MSMLRKLYDWTIERAATRQAERALAAVSFAESSFFPIPPDIMLVPMTLARPKAAWYLATLTTIASVAGGVLGYAIGMYLADSVGAWVIETYNLQAAFAKFQNEFAEWGATIIILKGLTPIPYKLVTIAAGMAHYDIVPFILASIVGRGMRFFAVAALLRYFGDKARVFIEKYLPWVTFAVFALIVLGIYISMVLA